MSALKTVAKTINSTSATLFCFGFSSGFPFYLLVSTLNAWLTEVGILKTHIGLFALATMPYALKFLWAPVFDDWVLPGLTRILGQRRSWLVLVQLGLCLALLGLSNSQPEDSLVLAAAMALMVGFFSASQDIIVEAYRIEILPKEKLGAGASASVLGFRFGMLWSGAGALYLAHFFNDWSVAYRLMACSVGVGLLTTMLSKEPKHLHRKQEHFEQRNFLSSFEKKSFRILRDYLQAQPFCLILLFILCFKFGDTVLNAMSMPFLLELGFDKLSIAHVAKTFGLSAMILGVVFGGVLSLKYSLRRYLLFCAFLQMLAACFFVGQAQLGANKQFLFLTMGVENFACGMSQVGLIAYLSSLCEQPHTGTQYALLSSCASLMRVGLTALAGFVADRCLWTDFYLLVSFACIPACLLLMVWRAHLFVDTHYSGYK